MKILVKSAKVVDKKSRWNLQVVDILIKNGNIASIATSIDEKADQTISFDGLHVSQGWFDSSVSFGEPGFEERETLENGLLTAAKSGFTSVALNPNNYPVADNQGAISFLKSKNEGSPVTIYPIGALTVKSEGSDLAELYDMQQAGAIAFGDYKKPVSNPNLLKIALQYTQNFNALVQSFPQENKIAGSGQVNENKNSTSLGLKGIPALAEELQIARDLFILGYTGGKLHIPTVSTAKAVELIREAKKKGLDVSCSVAIHNLLLTDELLKEFDTRTKVLPPLRTTEDTHALIEGVEDGTIDMVTSDHDPIDVEHKKMEFDNALYGTIGLETAFGALNGIFDVEKTIELLTTGKERFNIPQHTIEEGNAPNLSFFNPEGESIFGKENIHSSSENSIFLNQKMKGKVFGVFAKNQFISSK